ncbi:MAG: alpha-glucuronidase family glycosyl hydrolase [Chitinophagaceae bacterium]
MKRIAVALVFLCCLSLPGFAANGYELWLPYHPVGNKALAAQYAKQFGSVYLPGNSPTIAVIRKELLLAVPRITGKKPVLYSGPATNATLLIERYDALSKKFPSAKIPPPPKHKDGYRIYTMLQNGATRLMVTAGSDAGLLYGTFHLLRLLQSGKNIQALNMLESPKLDVRVLNHWDNLDRHVERGYAGQSIWNWHTLPGYIDQRYIDYARANASVGINGTVLTNVNANALVLSEAYILKVKALADVFRAYGIKVYLTARFSAPIELGKLKTADPLDPGVQQWWKNKAAEIYRAIPDFGGFLVKANSEGQPGPQNYNRTHVDGANMLADAVKPFGGIVMWRAFVYSNEVPEDRIKQAYNEFQPFDGQFRSNVLVQVKNGPLDFQPREPFHPLFGAMPRTQLMMEFQLTQEYLGFATHLVYLPLLQKEVLDANTFTGNGPNPVKQVLTTRVNDSSVTGIAGVANIGNDVNWCGHPFAQSNWYAFGRLAWNPDADPQTLAREWIAQTFSINNETAVQHILRMMLRSREAVANYMTPLGLTHIMGNGHHYGPAPWSDNLPRPDWNPVYYHRADSAGIGFNRTATGSNAIAQYSPKVAAQWQNPETCDENLLLWFHRLPWDFKMKNGNTLWNNLCLKYQWGVNEVRRMQADWKLVEKDVTPALFYQVAQLLAVQEQEAVWWKNACLLYFQTFSGKPFPQSVEQPDKTLDEYKKMRFPYAPGNG